MAQRIGASALAFGADGGSFAQIMDQRSGRARSFRMIGQSKPFKSRHAKLLAQNPLGVAVRENPFLDARLSRIAAGKPRGRTVGADAGA